MTTTDRQGHGMMALGRSGAGGSALAQIAEGWRALAEAESVGELAPIISGAELLREYAKRAGLGLRAQNEAAKLKIEAQAKAGEMLATGPKHPGGRPSENHGDDLRSFPPTLADQGVSEFQSKYWQKVARVPPEIRQRYYAMVERNARAAEGDDAEDGL
jgi:hypothetical protein